MDLSDLPDDVLGYDERHELADGGLSTLAAVATAPEAVLRDVVGRGAAKLRAAASYGLVGDVDAELLPRLLDAVPGGLGAFVQSDPKHVAASLNHDVEPEDQIPAERVLELQESGAVALVRLALAGLLERGWTTQLAAFASPDDEDARALLDLLEACGGFAKARPYLARIDELFSGFGGWSGAGRKIREAIAEVSERPDEMEQRRRELARDVATSEPGWLPGVGLETVVGIPAEAVARLAGLGCRTVFELRSANVAELARRSGLDAAKLETWRRQADLQARPGISPSTAYACVAFDAEKAPKRSVYEHVIALGTRPESLPDRTQSALYRFADDLYGRGAVPQDPFPYREGLQRDQQSLLALANLHAEVGTRNVLLDPGSDEAEALARACTLRYLDDVGANQRLFTPTNPLYFSFSPPPYPGQPDAVRDAASRESASYVLCLRVGGASGRVAFPSGLAFDVVTAEELEADNTLRLKYLPDPGYANHEYPRYWLRITDPASVWEPVSQHFQLRNFLSESEFLRGVAAYANAADARGSSWWDEFERQFPIYVPVALVHTVTVVQRLRDEVGLPLRVSSAYRSPSNQYSRAGSGSRHIWGTGVDIDLMGGRPVDFAPSREHPPNPVAWLAARLLVPGYEGWDGIHQLRPLPDRSPANLDHAVYVEDYDYIHTYGGDVWHLHFDWGYPSPEQERELILRYAPAEQGSGGSSITVTTPPARPEDWHAESDTTALAKALRQHLAGAFGQGTFVAANVPPPREEPDPTTTRLLRAGFPAVAVTVSADVARKLTAYQDQLAYFGRALVGGLLEVDRRHLAVLRGRVLWSMGKGDTPKPLAEARVGLTLGPATDISTSAAFGGQLGTEYQLYNETLTDKDGRYALYLVAPIRGAAAESKPVRIYAGGSSYNRVVIEYDPSTKPEQDAPDIVLTRVVMTPALRGCIGPPAAAVLALLAVVLRVVAG